MTEIWIGIRDRPWGSLVRIDRAYMSRAAWPERRRMFAALDVLYANAASRLLLSGRGIPVKIGFPKGGPQSNYNERD